MISDFDKRQLLLMEKKIDDYLSGNLLLSYLINDLEALLDVLENIDVQWKEKFKGFWWDLEQIYAFTVDKHQVRLSSDDENNINESLKQMNILINDLSIPPKPQRAAVKGTN